MAQEMGGGLRGWRLLFESDGKVRRIDGSCPVRGLTGLLFTGLLFTGLLLTGLLLVALAGSSESS